MKRFLAAMAALAALVVAFAVPSLAEGDDPAATPPAQEQAAQPVAAPKPLRNGCSTLYTRRAFHHYSSRVYQRRSLTRRAGRQITTMQRCQHSPRAERWARAHRKKLLAARRLRLSVYCGSPGCNRRLAFYLGARRWGAGGANCLVWIGDHEGSGWRTTTWNTGGSGAYGIPQALPGAKMSSHGRDWATSARTQIRWMMDYVDGRYGGPCAAQGYWQGHRAY